MFHLKTEFGPPGTMVVLQFPSDTEFTVHVLNGEMEIRSGKDVWISIPITESLLGEMRKSLKESKRRPATPQPEQAQPDS